MSKIEVDKVDPQSGTALEIGTSGDTITVPSGVTLTTTNATVNLPASVGGLGTGITNAQLAGSIDVTTKITGVVPAANLGTGTASSSTVLYGDGTFKAEPGGGLVKLLTTTISGAVAAIAFDSTYVTTTYNTYLLVWNGITPSTDNHSIAIALSVNNGVGFPTHTGYFVYNEISGSGHGVNGNLAYYPANTDILNTASTGGGSGYAYIYNTSASQKKWINGLGCQYNSAGSKYGFTSYGWVDTTSAINYMKLYEPEAAGNFSAGTATLYGVVA